MRHKVQTLIAISVLAIMPVGYALGAQQKPQSQTGPQDKPVNQQHLAPRLPDLTVTMKISLGARSVKDGQSCFVLYPHYTISNKGSAAAHNVKATLESKFSSQHPWSYYTDHVYDLMSPQQSQTHTGGPATSFTWCPSSGSSGWRITVDRDHQVQESNERNNQATDIYPPKGGRR